MYYAVLWDRTGIFEKSTMKAKADLEREIAGRELTALADVAEMRREMGLPASSVRPPSAPQGLAANLEIARAMREQMMRSLAPDPPSA